MTESVQYTYYKSAPLNDEERRRLRVSVATERCLAGNADCSGRAQLVGSLCGLLSGTVRTANPQLANWLLAYGTPKLIARLKRVSAQAGYGQWLSRAIARIDMSHLLTREHISPDYQRFQTKSSPRSALVCFTGSAQKLSVPVQLFHGFVAGRFDLVLYLRDVNKQFFTQGIRGIAPDMPGLFAYLRNQIPADCHLAVLSASGGGYAAVRFAEAAGAHRLAMFSPPFKFKDVAAVDGSARLQPDTACLYFGRANQKDAQYAADWAETDYAQCIRWFETGSHGTLRHVFECGQADALIGWLLGSGELPKRLRRPLPVVLGLVVARMHPAYMMRKFHEAFRGK
jgi:hypothetical protein